MKVEINGKLYEVTEKNNKFTAKFIRNLDESDKLPEIEIEGHKIYKYRDEYGKEKIGMVGPHSKGSTVILVLNLIFGALAIYFFVKTFLILIR